MQTVQVLADRCTSRIHIGKQGENKATRVEFDVKTWLETWPGATVALAVVAPHGDAYPATVTTENGITTWVVSSADTAYAGIGKCEIRILLGDVVKKSTTFQTFIAESFTASGAAPSPVTDWVEAAQETLGNVETSVALIEDMTVTASEANEPSATLTEVDGHYNIAFGLVKGDTGPAGADGQQGPAGSDGKDGRDGVPGVGVPSGGTTGQILKKKSGTDYDTEWADGGGSGGTSDYTELSNKPSIESVTLSGNKTASDLGLAKASDLSWKQAKITASGILKGDGNGGVTAATAGTDYGTYSKPSGGIPASDLASGVIPSAPSASSSTPQPLGTAAAGSSGDYARADHVHAKPTAADVGAAPASTVIDTVSGSTPTITGVADHRYVCGEVSTLSIQAPASGCIDVVFESGSTATVLTVTSAKTGVSVIKWANSFDPTSLDANTTYEINILDGEFGVVGKWT